MYYTKGKGGFDMSTRRDEILDVLLDAISAAADAVENRSRFQRSLTEIHHDAMELGLYQVLKDEILRSPIWGDYDDLLIDLDDEPLPAGQTVTVDLSEE